MRFAIDAHAIGQHLTGNEVYIRSLLRSCCAADASAQFIAYLSNTPATAQVPAGVLTRFVSTNPFVRLGWQLPQLLRRDRPALIHVQYTAPLMCPVPVVASVHDVSFIEHPEFFSPTRVFQLRRTVRRTVLQAARVLTTSEFSRDAIERHYPQARGKTEVVYSAVPPHFRVINKQQARDRVHKRFGITSPFILNVGDLQPRKNQIGLISAFEELIHTHTHLRHRLVFAGQDKWEASLVRQRAARSALTHRIHFTGWVDDEDLCVLYNAAELFVFPSFYEGFGIPILEAMASGCAVACSKTSAMPEVADGAAIFFDPHSTSSLMLAMRDVLLDSELRGRMERLGLTRAAAFSWDHAASKTLGIYYEVAGSTRPQSAVSRAVRVVR